MNEAYGIRFNLWLPAGIKERIRAVATAQNVSMSSFILSAIKTALADAEKGKEATNESM
jgi:predicted transcriptional regulator